MALGKLKQSEASKRTYLSISHGKVMKTATGSQEFFSYVEGTLENVYKKERSFNGAKSMFWYLDIRDGEELYCLSLPYNSGVFISIINALVSDERLNRSSPIRIEPYEKKGFTKVVVYSEGVKLDWFCRELPDIETIQVGNKEVKDDSKRMAYVEYLANVVATRVAIAQ